jgi:hypothetical protein
MRKKQTELSLVNGAANSETRIIKRQAKLLDQQRKTLGDISLEAIRIATLQLAVKKLEEGLRLLAQAGIQREQSGNYVPSPPAQPAVKNPCALCGRPGVYQAKNPALPVAKRPWYCEEGGHAQWARGEDREEQQQRAIMPSGVQNAQPQAPAPATPEAPEKPAGLSAAMAALQGQRPVNE